MAEPLVAPDVLERVLRTCTERAGSYNAYVCPNGHRTVVVLRDTGVTPFLLGCRHGHGPVLAPRDDAPGACLRMAQSTCYREPARGVPRWQWIRPTREEFDAYVALWRESTPAIPDEADVASLIEFTLEHVRQGGLVLVPLPWKAKP